MAMVTAATSFGRSGLHDWVVQRLTAVVLAAYAIYLFYFILFAPELSQGLWKALFADDFFRVFSVLALLSLMAHAWIGLWTVSTDYIKPLAVRFLFQAFVILFCLSNLIWGVQILWGL